MKKQQGKKLGLDKMTVQNYSSAIDNDMAQKIAGGNHPTHTKRTDKEHVCTGQACGIAVLA
jgi:hypothetical protein